LTKILTAFKTLKIVRLGASQLALLLVSLVVGAGHP